MLDHWLVALLLIGLAAYLLAAAGLWLAQDALIFPRYAVAPPAYELPPGTERIELRTAEGHRLVGNLVRAREPSRGLLLGFTGNAWHADDFTVFLAHRLRDVDIAAFHYRGYAPSEGRPGEAAITDDAVAAYDYLVQRLRPARVLLAGFSIGSGVAAALAARRPAAGLLLVTPFDSIEAVARARYPWLPVGRLLRHPFRSDRHLADLDLPTAVIIASHDRVVPAARTEALLRVLRRPVFVETVPDSTHGGLYHTAEIDEVLRRAIGALIAAGEPAERAAAAAVS